jgi:hypothetical protein
MKRYHHLTPGRHDNISAQQLLDCDITSLQAHPEMTAIKLEILAPDNKCTPHCQRSLSLLSPGRMNNLRVPLHGWHSVSVADDEVE